MIVKAVQDVEEIPVTEAGARGTTIRWMFNSSDGVPTFAMRYFVVKPGGSTPRHAHPWEHEVFVIKGTCTAFCEGETRQCRPRPRHLHRARRNSQSSPTKATEDLVFLCMIPIQ